MVREPLALSPVRNCVSSVQASGFVANTPRLKEATPKKSCCFFEVPLIDGGGVTSGSVSFFVLQVSDRRALDEVAHVGSIDENAGIRIKDVNLYHWVCRGWHPDQERRVPDLIK